jgi:hypothetical protein
LLQDDAERLEQAPQSQFGCAVHSVGKEAPQVQARQFLGDQSDVLIADTRAKVVLTLAVALPEHAHHIVEGNAAVGIGA